MKNIKQQDGFTLLEILVTINIAAITITLVVAFYLFTVKFLNSSIKVNEHEWDNKYFFYLLNKTLRNSNTLSVTVGSSSISLITSRQDSIHFASNKAQLKNIFEIDSIKNISVIIIKDNNAVIDFENGKLVTNNLADGSNNIVFDEIDVDVQTVNSFYPFRYLSPEVSADKFKDLNEN